MLPLPLHVCDAELRASYAAAIPDPDDTLPPPATTPTGPATTATTAAAAAAADPATTATAAAAAAEDELIPHFKPLSYAVSVFLLLFITAIGATWCWLMYCREEEPPMPPPKEPEPPTSTYRDHRRSMHKYTRWLMTHWRESKQRPIRKKRCPIGARSTNRSGGSDASEETERRRSKELVGRWLGSLDLLPDGGDRPLLSPGYP